MKSIFKKRLSTKKGKDEIIIVSGLPRSGTSMMMQMLEAGGMSIVTDNIRKADEDNPRGYLEFEKVKKINEDASWLEDCRGKGFKMVSELLYHLPQNEQYKIIFMTREMKEMLASQRVMLKRLEREGSAVNDDDMSKIFRKHILKVKEWLERQPNMDVIYMNYNDLVKKPLENAEAVSHFLNDKLNSEKMASVIDNSLYRQKNNP
ncbi:MAG: sulfotransferase domain-containing protein [Thermodesulfobacteriota bacterium]|nr:sulfotransferase domain-containing protein [Thermodesulfobacteriota bacterium]